MNLQVDLIPSDNSKETDTGRILMRKVSVQSCVQGGDGVVGGGDGGEARRAKDGGETQRVKDKDTGRERNREMSMKDRGTGTQWKKKKMKERQRA